MYIDAAVLKLIYAVVIMYISFRLEKKYPENGWIIGYMTGIVLVGGMMIYDVITKAYCP